MKLNVYCYYDRVAGVYTQPFYTPYGSDDFKESLRRAVVSGKADELKDCELYSLGTYDDSVCSFDLLAKPVFVARVDEWKAIHE